MRDISVVIPNYNNARYLRNCIQSIVNQSYPIEEIIVVDDCSTDNSKEVLLGLEKEFSNLTVCFLEQNGGVSRARNKGLSLVKTPYVTFMDADDFYVNDHKIENEMNLIKAVKKKSGKEIIAYSITVNCDLDGTPNYPHIRKKSFYLTGKIHYQLLQMWKWKSIMRDYCVKTDLVREIGGYNVHRNLFEDWELLLKLSRKTEFYCTMQYGPGYRISEGGLSSRSPAVYKETIKDIYEIEASNYSLLYRVTSKIISIGWNTVKQMKHALFH